MAENINPSGPYNTKIPGYNESADIQDALKLFLYGSTTVPADKTEVLSESIAGHLKSIEDDVAVIDAKGIGSIVSESFPTNVPNGYIWVDSTTNAESYSVPSWTLVSSGNLTGESLSVSDLNGEKLFIILKDWSHDNSGSVDFSLRFNNDSGPNYVNTGGLISASHLSSPEFPNSGTYDMTVSVDLANTASSLKPVSTIADIVAGSYFGYYKNTSPITSLQVILPSGTAFDSGSYEVWSYE